MNSLSNSVLMFRMSCSVNAGIYVIIDSFVLYKMIGKITKNYLGTTLPVINVSGVIKPALTQKVVNRLNKINPSRAAALAVLVNSSGGMPAQAQIIAQKLKDYSTKHNLKLYTFAKDVATSTGYLVLSAGDHVVADHSSLVGNIGVSFQKLKMRGLLQQFQVDRKHFASSSKLLQDVLSPFEETDPEAQQYLKSLCDRAHDKLVREIKKYRGNKLKDDGSIFSGQIFIGKEAQQRGLVDELGSLMSVLGQKHAQAKLDVQGDSLSIVHQLFNL